MGLVFWFGTAAAQQVIANPINEIVPSLEEFKLQHDLPSIRLEKKLDHYTCQRCGSENQVSWAQAIESPELIPHCNYCGKKYWPKFKPANAIPRTYCRLNLPNY